MSETKFLMSFLREHDLMRVGRIVRRGVGESWWFVTRDAHTIAHGGWENKVELKWAI